MILKQGGNCHDKLISAYDLIWSLNQKLNVVLTELVKPHTSLYIFTTLSTEKHDILSNNGIVPAH